MIAVIQRVRQASVTAGDHMIAHINQGLVILLGVAQGPVKTRPSWSRKFLN